MTTDPSTPILTIDNLVVSFHRAHKTPRRAVDHLSLTVHPAQTLALVGESGSGKSVTALSVLRLLDSPPARYDSGRILLPLDGRPTDVLTLPQRHLRRIRGGVAAMIFQEPMTSLNPVYTIGEQIIEAILLHQHTTHSHARDIALQSLASVGIHDPGARLHDYPHQFSGGMRQRVMIAIALACKPQLLLADEPTTALDVTVQTQILQLLKELQQQRNLAVLLITHSLNLVAEHADTVCVMYAGRAVEYASVFDLFDRPLHPYTRALLRCNPRLDRRERRLTTITELLNDPAQFTQGVGQRTDLQPWWPDPPPPLPPPQGSSLLEVEPRHWVACQRTNSTATIAPRPPDLPFRATHPPQPVTPQS